MSAWTVQFSKFPLFLTSPFSLPSFPPLSHLSSSNASLCHSLLLFPAVPFSITCTSHSAVLQLPFYSSAVPSTYPSVLPPVNPTTPPSP